MINHGLNLRSKERQEEELNVMVRYELRLRKTYEATFSSCSHKLIFYKYGTQSKFITTTNNS